MNTATQCNKVCEYCDKRGVAILPLRYGVVPAGKGFPTSIDPAIPLPAQAAHYTRRLLRSGYLYIYDEARKRWMDYFVTPEAYFFKLSSTPGIPAVLPQKPFDCPDEGHRELASLITIPDALRATKVWLGFSEVQWTEAVRSRHADAGYRKRHMRCVDVNAYAASADATHCLDIKQVGVKVAEYAVGKPALDYSLNWSPFQPDSRQDRTQLLVRKCEQLNPDKAFAVVVNDPVALTMELSALMKHGEADFMSKEDRKYHSAINGWVASLEDQIKDDTQRRWLDAASDEREVRRSAPTFTLFPATRTAYRASTADALARMDSAPQLELVANDAWQRYAKKLDPVARANWQNKFAADAAQLDSQQIAPLATAHAAWMCSEVMVNHMACQFDDADIEGGLTYTTVIAGCVAGTDDKKTCSQLYEKWLQGNPGREDNLLLNALVYNQKAIADPIAGTVNGVTWQQLPWDKLIDAHDKAVAKLVAGRPDVLGRLVGYIPGAIARTLKSAALSPKAQAGLVAIGVATRQPVVQVEIEGGKKAFRSALIRTMLKQLGSPVDQRAMQRAVAAELRRLEVNGVPLRGTDKKVWLLMIDPESVAGMPKHLSVQGKAQWLARAIRTPEQVEALNMQRFHQQVAYAETRARGVAVYSAGFAFAAMGVYANLVAWNSIIDDEKKAMSHVRSETLNRIWAQTAQLIGAAAAALEKGLARLAIPFLRAGAGAGAVTALRLVVGKLGNVLGIGGALVMSLIDLGRMTSEFREGNTRGAWAYGISGALGVAATVLLWAGWTGWGVLAALAMIGWAFVMTHLVDNKLQDWMERCAWGKLPAAQRYRHFPTEEAEFKKAVAG